MDSWKRDIRSFTNHLEIVEVGWPGADLLRHAGKPDSKAGGRWSYSWQQGGLGCQRYAVITFIVKEDRVEKIERGGGHKIIE